ncbi:hypothetical protein SaSA20_1690a [Streptococcus agalactiae]|nr:hypothetical protein SaSA20_1690a [Streptococcus agalactiae]
MLIKSSIIKQTNTYYYFSFFR